VEGVAAAGVILATLFLVAVLAVLWQDTARDRDRWRQEADYYRGLWRRERGRHTAMVLRMARGRGPGVGRKGG
jgi:hypothetical protein